MNMPLLNVVAAVIYDNTGNILLSRRLKHKHQGRKWEFPGGKIEKNETAIDALKRELLEELGIRIKSYQPLIKITHRYSDLSVLLSIWEVKKFTGIPRGLEGQRVKWFQSAELKYLNFPAANVPIVTAINLPHHCLVTPDSNHHPNFIHTLHRCLISGIKLIQFRAKTLKSKAYIKLANETITLAHQYQTKVILNSPPNNDALLKRADGLHLTSQQLKTTSFDNIQPNKLLSAACHNQQELKLAQQCGVDFVFLSAVKTTTSHPKQIPLGWKKFQALTQLINVPVYALGGLSPHDIYIAKQHGAQGIAAISQLWS